MLIACIVVLLFIISGTLAPLMLYYPGVVSVVCCAILVSYIIYKHLNVYDILIYNKLHRPTAGRLAKVFTSITDHMDKYDCRVLTLCNISNSMVVIAVAIDMESKIMLFIGLVLFLISVVSYIRLRTLTPKG